MSVSHSLLIPALDLPVLWVGLAYGIGALPFAVWIGRRAGQDPRAQGSKNPGASNVARTSGMRWGIFTLFLDAAKGALIPALILEGLLLSDSPSLNAGERITWHLTLAEWAALCGISAVLGHVTSPFLGFRGGRGVATALGATGALHPGIAGVGVCVWLTTLFLTRIPAWSSLAMSLSLLVLSQLQGVTDSVRFFCLGAAVIITIRHWTHLKRIFTGQSLSVNPSYFSYKAQATRGKKRGNSPKNRPTKRRKKRGKR